VIISLNHSAQRFSGHRPIPDFLKRSIDEVIIWVELKQFHPMLNCLSYVPCGELQSADPERDQQASF
jgi:hypothetical protein